MQSPSTPSVKNFAFPATSNFRSSSLFERGSEVPYHCIAGSRYRRMCCAGILRRLLPPIRHKRSLSDRRTATDSLDGDAWPRTSPV